MEDISDVTEKLRQIIRTNDHPNVPKELPRLLQGLEWVEEIQEIIKQAEINLLRCAVLNQQHLGSQHYLRFLQGQSEYT